MVLPGHQAGVAGRGSAASRRLGRRRAACRLLSGQFSREARRFCRFSTAQRSRANVASASVAHCADRRVDRSAAGSRSCARHRPALRVRSRAACRLLSGQLGRVSTARWPTLPSPPRVDRSRVDTASWPWAGQQRASFASRPLSGRERTQPRRADRRVDRSAAGSRPCARHRPALRVRPGGVLTAQRSRPTQPRRPDQRADHWTAHTPSQRHAIERRLRSRAACRPLSGRLGRATPKLRFASRPLSGRHPKSPPDPTTQRSRANQTRPLGPASEPACRPLNGRRPTGRCGSTI
jgi:hypothetical protein